VGDLVLSGLRIGTFCGRVGLGRAALMGLVGALIAACSTTGPTDTQTSALTPSVSPSTAAANRQPVTIALLLPMGGMGETARLTKSMKQAAEMALFERNDPSVRLVTKDDGGTAPRARIAADEAVREGAEIVLGPLFSQSVTGVTPVTRQAGLPVIAFSNDSAVAGNGVYLISVLAEQETERIISFAASQGKRRFAALIPDTPYGRAVQPAFYRAVQRAGGSVVIAQTYSASSSGMLAPVKNVVEKIKNHESAGAPVDALFLPGGQDILPQIGPVLSYSGLDPSRVKLLGTGGWNYAAIGRDNVFVGGWYPSPDPDAWRDFAERFARTFGAAPPRIASLAYDAVGIAINLSAYPPGARFTQANLTRPAGFAGVDGVVRFGANGLSEHSLAVLQVQKFGTSVVEAAPTSFQGNTASIAGPDVR